MRILVFSFVFYLAVVLAANASYAADRIVTLAPVLSEWAAEFLGEEVALKKLVGVSEYSVYPPSLKKIQTVGPYPQLNVEKIASLRPDLVVVSSEYNRPEQIEQLRRLKLNVQVIPGETFNSMDEWIKQYAKVLGVPLAGGVALKLWVQKLQELSQIKKSHPKRTVFLEIQHQPLITIGGASFLNDALLAIGEENIFSDLKQAYPKVSKEAVMKKNPDFILVMDLTGAKDNFEEARRDWQTYSTLTAVKKNAIQMIPGDDFARCSFRLLDALKKL